MFLIHAFLTTHYPDNQTVKIVLLINKLSFFQLITKATCTFHDFVNIGF